jgi:hypothetical protein
MKSSRTRTVSQTSILCPFCDAEPGRDCMTTEGRFAAIHVERLKQAGLIKYKGSAIGRLSRDSAANRRETPD